MLVVTAPAFNCFVDAVHALPGRIFISAVGEIGLGMAVEAEPGKNRGILGDLTAVIIYIIVGVESHSVGVPVAVMTFFKDGTAALACFAGGGGPSGHLRRVFLIG